MVDQRTCRPAGTGLGHVDLLHPFEPGTTVGGKQTTQARSEATPNGHRHPRPAGHSSQGQYGDRLGQPVTDQHGRPSGLDRGLHGLQLGAPGRRDDHDIGLQVGREGMVLQDHPLPQGTGDPCQAVGRGVPEDHPVHRVGGEQLPGHPGADRPGTEHGDPHQRLSGPESTRHPPDRGAVPAPPRRRTARSSTRRSPPRRRTATLPICAVRGAWTW